MVYTRQQAGFGPWSTVCQSPLWDNCQFADLGYWIDHSAANIDIGN